ncbi:hypothetical protein Cgig2_015515 [Carnegiea gigantea]|uniref:Uncharacterized protein n=1 Tax=Carnegiea gigantea TaxID=171969 RepID=A0A9Q1JTX0_9CARY|nr:hypothetical protein Cgig2_015515 [Carnegiea gigantea]
MGCNVSKKKPTGVIPSLSSDVHRQQFRVNKSLGVKLGLVILNDQFQLLQLQGRWYTFAFLKLQYAMKGGEAVTTTKLFSKTHSKAKDKTFADDRSKVVWDKGCLCGTLLFEVGQGLLVWDIIDSMLCSDLFAQCQLLVLITNPIDEKYLNKKIDMYDEMATVVGKDIARGSGAKSFDDVEIQSLGVIPKSEIIWYGGRVTQHNVLLLQDSRGQAEVPIRGSEKGTINGLGNSVGLFYKKPTNSATANKAAKTNRRATKKDGGAEIKDGGAAMNDGGPLKDDRG